MQIVHFKMVKNGEIYLSKFSFYIYISDNYFELQNIYTYTCVWVGTGLET